MHKDFGEWYRLAGIEPNGEILPKRWAAIEEYRPSRDDVVSLARLFYDLGKPTEDFIEGFRNCFHKADPAFKMRDNDRELSVLAGAKLVDVMDHGNADLADLAALALVSAAAGNLRSCPSVRDIPEIAARYLSDRATNRALLGAGVAESEPAAPLFEELAALGTPHKELAEEIQRLAEEIQQLRRQLSLVAEESNMLWWLFSEHSRDEQQRWATFSVPAVTLMAGKELADLTTVIPGPIAAAAFLDRVIRSAKAKSPTVISVKDAINAVTIQWRQRYMPGACPCQLEDLLPIGHAVKLSLESPANDAWLPAFVRATGIASDATIPPHILAYQVFLEGLLSRSWKELR